MRGEKSGGGGGGRREAGVRQKAVYSEREGMEITERLRWGLGKR